MQLFWLSMICFVFVHAAVAYLVGVSVEESEVFREAFVF